jgi:hypothetical protein
VEGYRPIASRVRMDSLSSSVQKVPSGWFFTVQGDTPPTVAGPPCRVVVEGVGLVQRWTWSYKQAGRQTARHAERQTGEVGWMLTCSYM